MAKKNLNIGMVGYGFMGRTHSNAFSQVGHFFDVAPIHPVLKAVCARDAGKEPRLLLNRWVVRSTETDWRDLRGSVFVIHNSTVQQKPWPCLHRGAGTVLPHQAIGTSTK